MSAKKKSPHLIRDSISLSAAFLFMGGGVFAVANYTLPTFSEVSYIQELATPSEPIVPHIPPLDKHAYDTKLLSLAHVATSSPWYQAFLHGTTTLKADASVGSPTSTSVGATPGLWPVRASYPGDSRALLPFNRIIAYYGNFYSRAMGALGEYEPQEMLARLTAAADEWRAADPTTPVIPAIHYIVTVAQASSGEDGKYRARMPDAEVEKALALAEQINGILFLDMQVGLSDVESEVPVYEEYLKLPQVHLGLDPEFSMQESGMPPGTVIGTVNAQDINYTAGYLASLVKKHDLPPKILVVHRFTRGMVQDYQDIEPLPEVQVVIDMDGWGPQAKKIGTYNQVIYPEPVQFTGFKLFYKNDTKDGTPLLSPVQVLELTPAPSYIQYQ
jgi:hypothetical protein